MAEWGRKSGEAARLIKHLATVLHLLVMTLRIEVEE